MDCPMYASRAIIVCLLSALTLSGCMGRSAPVAAIATPGQLDDMAYSQSSDVYAPTVAANTTGAGTALRASFAAPRSTIAAPPAYAEASIPVAYDKVYRLDAGDRLRIVVYGQEGLTN